MSKKALVLTSAIIAALAFHACTLPSSVIIKGKPQIDLPVKVNYDDFNFMIMDTIKDAVKDTDITVLDYTGYYSGNKNIQTFLIHYPILQDFDLGLRDEIEHIKNFKFTLPTDDLSHEFDIGELSDINNALEPIEFEADLSPLFDDLRTEINDGFDKVHNVLSIPSFPITGAGASVDNLPDFGGQLISLSVLNILTFGEGKLYITIGIPATDPNLPGVDITFSDLRISDGIHNDPSNEIIGEEEISGLPDIRLTAADPKKTVVFDLAGKTLSSDFGFYIHFKNDQSDITPPNLPGRTVTLNIIPEKISEDVKFRGITGLTNETPFIAKLDDQIMNNNLIDLDFPSGEASFVHAEIGTGTLDFEFILPSEEESDGTESWAQGFEATLTLRLMQDHSVQDADNKQWPGINNNLWPGINQSNAALLSPAPDPWDFNGIKNNLDGKHINTKPIAIQQDSEITLEAVNASFWLSDEDMDKESVVIRILPKLDIETFAWVHFEIGDVINDFTPSVPPVKLTGASKYIMAFYFNAIGPRFTFGRVDIPGIEIMLSVPELGINNGTEKEYKTIPSEGPEKIVEFINVMPEGDVFELALKDSTDTLLTTELNVDIQIRPAENKKVLGIPNLNLSDTTLKFEVTDVDFVFDWEHATIDIGTVEDHYPKLNANPDTIDLSPINLYLKGFEFDTVDVLLYPMGPTSLFEFLLEENTLEIVFDMEYTNSNGDVDSAEILDEKFWEEFILTTPEPFQLDPNNTGTYSGPIPPGGIPIKIIPSLLKKDPVSAKFHYKVNAQKGLSVTPAQFNEIDFTTNIDLEALVIVPLLLTAGPDGADIILPNDDLFEGKNDILDRDNSSEPLPVDFIKSLTMKVVFNSGIFNGGKVFLDNGDRRIELPLSGNALGLSITGDDLDYINATIPYLPEIGISFSPGDHIQIERNLGTIKIDFNAEIEYELNLDDLGL